MDALSFRELRAANLERVQLWHPGFPRDHGWNGADWSNAMGGECGEAQNVVKKLRRAEEGVRGAVDPRPRRLVDMLGAELADTVTYADLLAAFYDIDLGRAVVLKFNSISEREGFPQRLPVS